ncbi:MAG: 4-hydroxybenzoyl-CoA reductase [Nitriliruptorales bacterium]|nr:4-hydroxybenzoyl-CoA reductase [Nitriliruptorales bacterium]
MTVQRFLEPRSLAEAVQLGTEDPSGAKLIAGGTALTIMMLQGFVMPDTLVSLGRIDDAGFRSISVTEGRVRIGGGVTLTDVAVAPEVAANLPSLAYACAVVGNTRVRNVATLGGNLAEADYASDPPSVLISLGATVEILGPDGQRTLPVGDLITGFYETALPDGAVITAIDVPVTPDRVSVYEKFRTRSSEDRPCVGVAASATFAGRALDDLEVVIGAVAATPQRDPALGDRVRGAELDDALARSVAAEYRRDIEPMDDARGSAWYRSRMIEVLVRRSLRALADARDAEVDA